MRRCIFCHKPLSGNKAREHVLPQWLEREIGGGSIYYDHPLEGDTSVGFSLLSTDKVSATASTRVEGRVCVDCNSVWLSSLETAAKPIVSNLVFGRTGIDALSPEHRHLLATWLYKTFLVGVSSGAGEYDIHECDYHQFRATGQPGHWANIYAAVLESDCGGFCGPAEMKWPEPKGNSEYEPSPDPSDRGLKWVMHIGKLHAAMCYTTIPNAEQVVLEGLHAPVWTPQPYISRPGKLMSETSSSSLVQWLAFGLIPTLQLLTNDSAASV
ncbi:MAG: hypothetical protein PF636_05730 [Actinomycetota bacterium]|jgi:hypothetical protein|nr:hypothetical protein [Actinomycetota bacterium]